MSQVDALAWTPGRLEKSTSQGRLSGFGGRLFEHPRGSGPDGTKHRAGRVVLTGRDFPCQCVFGTTPRAVLGAVVTFGQWS
eukprot:15471780-Alexandrium_andersonii.AAC.1